MGREPKLKRKIEGETFVLMSTHQKKGRAKDWAEEARQKPHNARARVLPIKQGWGVYCSSEKERKRRR